MKRFNKEKLRCPVEISEEFITVFLVKLYQNNTENDKNPKFSNFRSFYAFFLQVSTDFLDWKVLKGQQGKSWLSSSLS